jgi:hypothetical protein
LGAKRERRCAHLATPNNLPPKFPTTASHAKINFRHNDFDQGRIEIPSANVEAFSVNLTVQIKLEIRFEKGQRADQ